MRPFCCLAHPFFRKSGAPSPPAFQQVCPRQGVRATLEERRVGEYDIAVQQDTGGNLVDQTSAVPMWCSDAETGLIVEANEAALRYWGYDRDTFVGMHATQMLCDDELKRQRKLSRTAIRGLTGPWKCRRADGSVIFATIRWERTERGERLYDLVRLHSSGERMETLTRVQEKPLKPAGNRERAGRRRTLTPD